MDHTTIVIWFTPDPAEQFHNPYLAMGNNPVIYTDPDGRFAQLPVFVVLAWSAAKTAAVIGTSMAIVATAATLATTTGTGAAGAGAGAAPTSTEGPPDEYLWDPANPNERIWIGDKGGSELNYYTNTQTGETITQVPELVVKNPTAELGNQFTNLNSSSHLRTNYIMTRMNSLPASSIEITQSSTLAQAQTGLSSFKASQAVKMQLLKLGGPTAVPGWYSSGMLKIGVAGAVTNSLLSYSRYTRHEITFSKFIYDATWSSFGAIPHPYTQFIYWSGVAGQHVGPSTWGWDLYGTEQPLFPSHYIHLKP